jgi:hypothetical protein
MLVIGHMSHDAHSVENKLNGYVGALSNQFSNNVGNVPGNRYRADFFLDYHNKDASLFNLNFENRFTATAQFNDQNLGMYSVPELYTALRLTSKDTFKLGRQVLPWSTADVVWGFGKLNNRINFDFFEPGQEGLVGLQYERRSSNGFRVRIFASGLYVPETNPPLDINRKEKTITSRHPWADPPAQTTDLDGREKTIEYTVDYPQIQDVIYRYSIGGNIGWESKNWVFDNFIIRKPENGISPQVEVKYAVLDPNDPIKAYIQPQFYYHDVYGSNLRYRNKDLEIYVSGLATRPNTFPDGNVEDTNATEIKTEKRREDYLGGGIAKVNDLYGIGFNYVARLSPFDRTKDILAVDPRWNQAVNMFVLRTLKYGFKVSADYKYDMLTYDRLAMFRVAYAASRDLQMNFGVNLIGTPNEGNSFWSPFTNNDAVYGGLRYIF